MNGNRTDLAYEELPEIEGDVPGVEAREKTVDGFSVTEVSIQNAEGEKALCKPIGKYITIDMEGFFRRDEDAFRRAVRLLADCIRSYMPLQKEMSVLVAGLGNAAITPDALGPYTAENTLATRHLIEQMPGSFSGFRSVSVLQTGVMGTTGLESSMLVRTVAGAVEPSAVVVVDALAARSAEKLCRTVQLTDSGIVPGSGVGNDRAELSPKVLGVPVLAIGVPTVVDVGDGLVVTPRNIDRYVKDVGKLIGYALNLALHEGLTIEDVDMFVG